ncbi:hypothetical protein NRF22_05485 [Oenococcus kitaharae]|uniref:hypothetical protein n=2 Tax=Lactobacillaceae TaxID=33958 RepID=UPI0021E6EAA5|nr:hypothetical protein [Oenococcus kitaharae]MCV3296566.1 hypothetical protein [Oenococcus kitaharae]
MTVQVFTAQYEDAGFISQMKYLFCLFGIFLSAGSFFLFKRHNIVFSYELRKVLQIVIVFGIISLYFIVSTSQFTSRTLYELFFLAIPAIYTFFLLNVVEFKDLNHVMFILLCISLVGYFFSLHMSATEILSAISSINFTDSFSLLESSSFAGISMSLVLYYLFYRNNKVGVALSLLFVMFTFKRLAVVTALILFFVPLIVDCTKPVNRHIVCLTKILLFLSAVLYFITMTPEMSSYLFSHFNFDLNQFTMSRSDRFLLIYQNPNFINDGLGSVYTYMMNHFGFSLEMDAASFILEVTPVGLAFFINNLIDISKRNWYEFVVMIYLILNMITSHSIASMFAWLLTYLAIGSISYLNSNGVQPLRLRANDEVTGA